MVHSTSSGISRVKDWLNKESTAGAPSTPIGAIMFEGKSLEEIERRSRGLSKEEIVFLDENGNPISAYRGGPRSVGFPERLLFSQNATVTHNHPRGVEEFGGTFSFADINNMLRSNWKEHRATASGRGEMNYIMRRGKNANPSGLRDRINRDYEKLDKEWQDVYRKTFKAQVKAGKKPSQARHVERQKGVGVLNAYYKRVFPEYGYEYITRKKPYKYNR